MSFHNPKSRKRGRNADTSWIPTGLSEELMRRVNVALRTQRLFRNMPVLVPRPWQAWAEEYVSK